MGTVVLPTIGKRAWLQDSSSLIVEGAMGFGQIVGPEAINMGLDVTSESGMAIVALKNAHHLGRIGGMGEQAAISVQLTPESIHLIADASDDLNRRPH